MHEAEMPENAPARTTAVAARDKAPRMNFKPGSAGFEWLGRSTETPLSDRRRFALPERPAAKQLWFVLAQFRECCSQTIGYGTALGETLRDRADELVVLCRQHPMRCSFCPRAR